MSVVAPTPSPGRGNVRRVPASTGLSSDATAILKLLPLLALYLTFILLTPRKDLWTDEGGYTRFATNLTHGYYSPPDQIDLWWGPGYPMVLSPFALLKLPWGTAKFLNAFFMFLAVVYFYKTLRFYISSKYLVYWGYAFGLYPPALRFLSYLMTESLVVFLMSAIAYHVCRLSQEPRRPTRHQFLAGLYLGFLALTKVFYGWVILPSLILLGLVWLTLRKPVMVKQLFFTCCIAYLLCLPYLLYTYRLTGKMFYWGTSGGISLYYMSTPFEGEYGDWGPTFSTRERWLTYREELAGSRGEGSAKMAENHLPVFEEISKLPDIVKQDDAFKRVAIRNIKERPVKYFKNWLTNVGRLLFDYPYSYRTQTPRTYFYALPNMFIVVLAVISIVPLWVYRRSIPKELYALLAFAMIALGGTSLMSAQSRQFYVLTPIIDVVIVVALVHAWRSRSGKLPQAPRAGAPDPLPTMN